MSSPAPAALRDAAAAALGPGGSVAHDPWTTFTRYAAPFLERHGIWALDHQGEDSSFWAYLAWAPGERARLLTARPGEFVAVARDDGVVLAAGAQAVAYALAFLHTTRPAVPLTTVLRSPDDLPAVPAPDPDEQLRLAVLARRHGAELAPVAHPGPDGRHVVTVHLARDRELVRVLLTVARDGRVDVSETVVATGLPFQSAGLG